MENYVKAPKVESNADSSKESNLVLIESLQLDPSVIHMHVKPGSKVSNLLNYANKQFKSTDIKQITWNGSGEALNKVVACAEIMKKDFKDLYQINKIGFINDEEIWNSKLESLREYQTRSTIDEIFNNTTNNSKNKKNKTPVAGEEIYVKKRKNNKI